MTDLRLTSLSTELHVRVEDGELYLGIDDGDIGQGISLPEEDARALLEFLTREYITQDAEAIRRFLDNH